MRSGGQWQDQSPDWTHRAHWHHDRWATGLIRLTTGLTKPRFQVVLICKFMCFRKVRHFWYVKNNDSYAPASFMTVFFDAFGGALQFTLVFTMLWESPSNLWQYLQWIGRANIDNCILWQFLQVKRSIFTFFGPLVFCIFISIYNKNTDFRMHTKRTNIAKVQ